MTTPMSTPSEFVRIEESSGGNTVRFATPAKGKRDRPEFKIQVNYEMENMFSIEISIEKNRKLEKVFEYCAEKSAKLESKL